MDYDSLSLFFSLSEHTFEFIVEQQPIGHKLFLAFCERDLQLSRCMQFLHAVDELKIATDGRRQSSAQTVFDDFISVEVQVDSKWAWLSISSL